MEQATHRARQAAATRAEILATARRLFAERGFSATSVADIAREAGVAVPTVYKSAGSKQVILRALVDAIDAEGGIPEGRAEMMAAEDAGAVLRAAVRTTRRLHESCADLLAGLASAAVVDEGARAVLAEGERRHRMGMTMIAERISGFGGLRKGVAVDEAAVALGVLTSRATYVQLTGEYGWSFDRAEEWIAETLEVRLLRSG